MKAREQLIEFFKTIARPGSDLDAISDEENLVEAGVLDSLAIVQVVIYLETNHQLNVSAIDPTELVSIAGILGVIEE